MRSRYSKEIGYRLIIATGLSLCLCAGIFAEEFKPPASAPAENSENANGENPEEAPEKNPELSEPSGAESQKNPSETETAPSAPSAGINVAPSAIQRIESAIRRDPAAKNVQIFSENGKIILRGTVNSAVERSNIEKKIQQFLIENQLKIQGANEQEKEPDKQ